MRTSLRRPLQQPYTCCQRRFHFSSSRSLAEDLRMLAPEGVDRLQCLSNRRLRFPSGVLRELGVIAHINELVAGTPSLVRITQALAGHRGNLIDQLDKRNGILGSAANVVDLTGCFVQ